MPSPTEARASNPYLTLMRMMAARALQAAGPAGAQAGQEWQAALAQAQQSGQTLPGGWQTAVTQAQQQSGSPLSQLQSLISSLTQK
jgi:hypothetical protein